MCYSPLNLPKRNIRLEVKLSPIFISDLKQTKQATAMRTPPKKELISRTTAVHLYFKTLYISKPSSAKQERGMTD